MRSAFAALLILLIALPSSARILHVPDEFQTIQNAVDSTSQQVVDTVMLADGEHLGAGNVNVAVARPMVITSESGAAFCTINGEDTGIAFTLTAAATIEGISFTRFSQNAIRATNIQNGPTILNCRFVSNESEADQQAGVGIQLRTCTAVVANCWFDRNTTASSGGGLALAQSQALISGCVFNDNHSNRFGGGVIVTNNSTGTIFNCLFARNTAGIDGGGVSFSATSRGTVSNCTFSENTAVGWGGGIYKGSNSNPEIINSIFWGNQAETGNQLGAQDNGGEITIRFCIAEGGPDEEGRWDGDEIIDEDPRFTDGRDPDWGVNGFFLDDESPGLDAASDEAENLGLDTLFTSVDRSPDEGTGDLGFHYYRPWFWIVGRLFGRVLDAENNQPLAGAQVFTSQRQRTVSDDQGSWEIPRAFAGVFNVAASFPGYNNAFVEDRELEEDGELEVILRLTHPEIAVEPDLLASDVGIDDSAAVEFRVLNEGNGLLTWSAFTQLIEEVRLDPWELRASIPVGEIVGDNQLYGIATDGSNFYISGADGNAPNKIYVLDPDWQLTGEFVQPGTAITGIRDLTFDGELLWGPSGRAIIGFETDGDSITSFPGPANPTSCVTYDPVNQIYWASGTTSEISGYDRAGNQVSFARRGSSRMFGLGYLPGDVDGQELYAFGNTSEDLRMQVFKTAPEDTLQQAALLLPPPEGNPQGMEMLPGYDLYSIVMMGLVSSDSGDRVDLWQVLTHDDWMSISPASGEVAAGEAMDVTLSLVSAGLAEGVYQAEAVFSHNGREADLVIPIEMEVMEGEVFARRPIDFVFGWNLVSATLQPEQADIRDVLRPLVEAGVLLFAKDIYGRMWRPGPNQFHNMEPWDVEQAYWIKVSAPAHLMVEGTTVRADRPIEFDEGWNGLAYFPRAVMEPTRAFGGILDAVDIIRDGQGHFMLPRFEFNNLPPCRQGLGYLMRAREAGQLVWGQGGEGVAAFETTREIEPVHFGKPMPTGSEMSLLVIAEGLDGAEIGVYSGDRLVGAGVVTGSKTGVALRGDDPSTGSIEGARDGGMLTLKVIDLAGNIFSPESLTILEGGMVFRTNGLSVIDIGNTILTPVSISLGASPNPFNGTTLLKISVPKAGTGRLVLYDTNGRLVRMVSEGVFKAGDTRLALEAGELSSGLYLLKLEAVGESRTVRLALLK
jgi:hypothetical protein